MTNALLPDYDYALETVLHLRCTVCSGWWILSAAPIDRAYFCPYCGRHLTPAQYPDDPKRPSSPPKELPL